MVTKFKGRLDKDIAFVCLDILKNVEDSYIKNIVKNIADFTVQNLADHGYDVYVTRRYADGNRLFVDDVLKQIKNDYTHAVVYTNDTEFEGSGFFSALEDLVKGDFFVAGHILDRSNFDAYYEIHDQCFVVNLKEYINLGTPKIGEKMFDANLNLLEVIPSREQYHDNYTPKSVCIGDTLKKYKNVPFGYNWINTGAKIKVFDESIRNSKRNYYSQYTEEFHKNISYNFRKHQYASAELFYPANTEEPIDLDIDTIEQIVVPASGLNFLYYLDKYGYNESTEVIFYDNNPNSLRMMSKVINEFNGDDYVKFVRENCTGIFASNEAIEEHWNKFKKLWPIINDIKFSYSNTDAMYDVPKGMRNGKNVIYNLTNVFMYEPNAAFRSLKHRIESQNTLFKRLKNSYKDVNIIVSAYADQSYGKTKSLRSKASDLEKVTIEQLMIPAWQDE
jgi:hypothetical protein